MFENRLILWLILGAVLIAVLNLPLPVTQRARSALREAFAPLQQMSSGLTRGARESAGSLRGYKTLLKENQGMLAEMARLQAEVRNLKSLEGENDRLRQQLQFTSRMQRSLIPCEVISREPSGWWQTIRLNKGSMDGIKADMAVITVEGLVGKTIDVSTHTADVLLVSDPGCKVSAQIQRTGTFGILSGRGPSWQGQVVCRMEFINKNVPIIPGDEVLTSGLGGVFPKGLLIGYIDKVFLDRNGLYQHADIISKADIGLLQNVFIVREVPGGNATAKGGPT